MKNNDQKILSHLRNDGRMSLTKMSKQTGIPVSTIFDRIKAFDDDLILKHTAILNFSKLGYNTRATIFLKIDRENKKDANDFLVKNMNINSIYKINNGFDFMIEGIFKNIQEMDEFLESLESKFKVIDRKSHYIISDIKREGFMTDTYLPLISDD